MITLSPEPAMVAIPFSMCFIKFISIFTVLQFVCLHILIDLFYWNLLTFHANVFDVNCAVGPKYCIRMMLIEYNSTVVFTGTSERKNGREYKQRANIKTREINKQTN